MSADKIISPDEIETVADRLRAQKATIVFTNGVFDLLHPGHVDYLTAARKEGSHLIVGVNSDASARRIKGEKRPLVRLEERIEVLAAWEAVSLVTWFEEDTPEQIIRRIRPDVLIKGDDWKIEEIVGKGFVESCGGRVLTLPYNKGYSTSAIIEKIFKL
ncbi:MAG TPA: D-glycero-beta-D-manno-heptose 1-phosphate adenylyltransferase [Acidobacteriota bacterium]|nr:D-glycero-beta-D-manno-heptose 1-phosphate adenylyltransferase [Acidobacteriota bacterium]